MPPYEFSTGEILAERYLVKGLLGSGGMGAVYRAFDLEVERLVAVKIPHPFHQEYPRLKTLLCQEAQVAQGVAHPNVCKVYDVAQDRERGLVLLSMELLRGKRLEDLLADDDWCPSRPQKLDLMRQLCAGLQAIHEQGLIHRDLRPANVMIEGGRPKILDFGLTTHCRNLVNPRDGYPPFMAPELFHGTQPSRQSDLYSLGLVLYQLFLFTGGVPDPVAARAELRRELARDRSLLAEVSGPSLPARLARQILRCLEEQPRGRPDSVEELARVVPDPSPVFPDVALLLREPRVAPSAEAAADAASGDAATRPARDRLVVWSPGAAWTCLAATLVGLLLVGLFSVGMPSTAEAEAPSRAALTTSASASAPAGDPWTFLGSVVLVLGLPLVLGCASWLAWRRLREGHADLPAALRLVLLVFVTRVVGLLSTPDSGSSREPGPPFDRVVDVMSHGLFCAVVVGVVYLAVEPWVRTYSAPRAASWIRLLYGRAGDALVGRDLMIGVLSGIGLLLWVRFHGVVPTWLGWSPDPSTGSSGALGWTPSGIGILESQLGSFAETLSVTLLALIHALLITLLLSCVLVLLRRALSSKWLSRPLGFLLFAVVLFPAAAGDPMDGFLATVGAAGLVFGVLYHFGFLATITTVVIFALFTRLSTTLDSSGAALPASWVPWLFTLVIALWGAWASLGAPRLKRLPGSGKTRPALANR